MKKQNSYAANHNFKKKLQVKFLFLLKNNKLTLKPYSPLKPSTAQVPRKRQLESLTPYYARTNILTL